MKLSRMLGLAAVTSLLALPGVAAAMPQGSVQTGTASWYQMGTKTASGACFKPDGMSAAHRSLPFGTRVLVVNRKNGKSVNVVINDRGPFTKGRMLDLSRGAAGVIGLKASGTASVTMTVVSLERTTYVRQFCGGKSKVRTARLRNRA